MNRIVKLTLIIIGITSIIACDSNPPKSDVNSKSSNINSNTNDVNSNSNDISLNNGEKWMINTEMKPHIEKGDELLNEFVSNQDKDWQSLAKNLTNQNNALIESCTMKGESHNELHKWLHPHMKLTEQLANAKNNNDAEVIITKLENSFKTFHQYFQ